MQEELGEGGEELAGGLKSLGGLPGASAPSRPGNMRQPQSTGNGGE